MAAKLTKLTQKIAIQLHIQWQRAVPFAVLASGGQSGKFEYTLLSAGATVKFVLLKGSRTKSESSHELSF
jgi:hypothetical protein